jgi:hypothetical protein
MMIDSIALRTVTRKHIVAGARSVAKRLISQAREEKEEEETRVPQFPSKASHMALPSKGSTTPITPH